MPPLSRWNGLSLPNMAIGQGLAATPLQMLQVYNTIANDGVLVPLRLIDDGTRLSGAAETGAGAHPQLGGGVDADANAGVGGAVRNRPGGRRGRASRWLERPARRGSRATWATSA